MSSHGYPAYSISQVWITECGGYIQQACGGHIQQVYGGYIRWKKPISEQKLKYLRPMSFYYFFLRNHDQFDIQPL